MKRMRLEVCFHEYWHCGSGSGRGSTLDAVVERDHAGLPYVPGRTLKGLLRDAVATLEGLQQRPTGSAAALFGLGARAGLEQRAGQTRHDSVAGMLFVSDARLPQELAGWLAQDAQKPQRRALFGELFSTAVDPVSHVALDKSLRSIEVVVPLTLHAELSAKGAISPDWQETLARALPLVTRIGANRSRGLGRCSLALEECGS